MNSLSTRFNFENFYEKFKENNSNLNAFKHLLNELFTNYDYNTFKDNTIELFRLFDQDQDSKLNDHEFKFMWINWIEKLFKIKFAILIIDMQNDFMDGGALAIKNGESIIPIINKLINENKFDKLIYTLDHHPIDHISFFDNHNNFEIKDNNDIKLFDTVTFLIDNKEISQTLWPIHCVQNTNGSKLHKDLLINEKEAIKIYKGENKFIDSYSAFFDNQKLTKTDLDNILKTNEIDVLFAVGVATDYCVGETCKDALKLGYPVVLIEDAIMGVNDESSNQMKSELTNQNCVLINSDQVNNLIHSKDRRFEIGFKLAKKLI